MRCGDKLKKGKAFAPRSAGQRLYRKNQVEYSKAKIVCIERTVEIFPFSL